MTTKLFEDVVQRLMTNCIFPGRTNILTFCVLYPIYIQIGMYIYSFLFQLYDFNQVHNSINIQIDTLHIQWNLRIVKDE